MHVQSMRCSGSGLLNFFDRPETLFTHTVRQFSASESLLQVVAIRWIPGTLRMVRTQSRHPAAFEGLLWDLISLDDLNDMLDGFRNSQDRITQLAMARGKDSCGHSLRVKGASIARC